MSERQCVRILFSSLVLNSFDLLINHCLISVRLTRYREQFFDSHRNQMKDHIAKKSRPKIPFQMDFVCYASR